MENNFSIFFAMPAIIALLFKVIYLFKLKISTSLDKAFTYLCLIMVVQSSAEVVAYSMFTTSVEMTYLAAHGFMIATYYMLSAIVLFSLTVCQKMTIFKSFLALIIPTILTFLHLNGHIVIGWNIIDNRSISSIQGPAYIYFRVFLFTCIIYSLLNLAVATKNEKTSAPAWFSFIGLLPLTLTMAAILILKSMNYEASSAMVMPLCTLAFLWTAAFSSQRDVFDVADLAKMQLKILRNIFFKKNGASVSKLVEEYELFLLISSFKKSDGTQADTARLLKTTDEAVKYQMIKYGLERQRLDDGSFVLRPSSQLT